MKLSELKTGEKAVIVKVLGYGGFRKRLVEMGFIKGKTVQSILSAPPKDPVKYSIMGYEISLRRSEAEQIEVMSLDEANLIAKEQIQNHFHGTLTEEEIRRIALNKRKEINIALVGNPNSGKTSLFNNALNKKEPVGNYGGVTVGSKKGTLLDFEGYRLNIVDLPGTYSLTPYSPEERYVREHIVVEKPDIIINVLDASILERSMYLTTQLIDMNVPMVIALNMYDELEKKGDTLDYKTLEKLIGIPIIPTVSAKKTGSGTDELLKTVIKLYESDDIIDEDGNLIPSISDDTLIDEYLHRVSIHHKHTIPDMDSDLDDPNSVHATVRHIHINHGPVIEEAIDALKIRIAQNPDARDEYTPRYLAIKLLEGDTDIETFIGKYPNHLELIELRNRLTEKIKSELKETPETAITYAKNGFIVGALKETLTPVKVKKQTTRTAQIDAVLTSGWGYAVFLAILAIVFSTTFLLGEYPKNWIDELLYLGQTGLRTIIPESIFKDFLIDGVVEGLKSVIVFVPQIFLLFFFIVLLELSGYMARVVFILDKIMHKFGLHGRSCIPLLMGTGCNVPAILATRSIENKSSRMITMLINPLIPCTARIPIYVLLAGAFFPRIWFLVVAAMYLTGFVLALLMAKVFRKFLFKKEETPYVMELPPYRMPAAGSLWKHTIKKVGEFCKKIFTWVLLGCALIWLFSYFPRNEAATNVYHLKADSLQQEIRLCDAQISRLHQQRMQIYESDNNLGISFLQHNDRYISYFRSIKSAKEREISQLNYTIDTLQKGNSYLGRLGKTIEPVMKPLGFNWKICIAVLSGLMAKEVVVSSLAIMHNVPVADEGDVTKEEESRTQQSLREERNNTGDYAYNPPVALSLMIFILIYFPCIATIAVIKTESKWKWALFVVFYSIALAWIASFIVYQTAKLCVAYPFHALGIFGVALALLGFYIYRRVHKKLKIEN